MVIIIDTLKLRDSPELLSFLFKLFTSATPIKLGHSVSMDMAMLRKTFNFPAGFVQKARSIVDLVPLFTPIASSRKVALSVMCKEIFGKDLSKLEQIGDWDSRPLRESQVHYAGMDAFILVKLYEKIIEKIDGFDEKEHVSQCDSAYKSEMEEEAHETSFTSTTSQKTEPFEESKNK